MKIKILRSAKQDIKENYWFYETQQQGIGTYFLEAIFADIESVKLYAGIHVVCFDKYYKLLSKRFPFAIYYRKRKKYEFTPLLIVEKIRHG